jgi:general secretion pathway protein B
MSYILDALRRADAERERDPARGIHAQPRAPEPAHGASPHSTFAWGAAVVVAALVATYAWWPRPPQVVVATVAAPAQPAPVVLPVAAAPVAPVAPVAPKAPVAPVEPHVRPAARPVNVQAPVTAPALPGSAAAPASPANAGSSGPVMAPALPATAATGGRIYAVSELPADVQRELPKLAISGGVHSENPAQRMLIVGGQVMFEGAELAPGVVLEQIRPKSAVLRFRGWRYSVAY